MEEELKFEKFKKLIEACFGSTWAAQQEPLFRPGTIIVTRTIDLLCKQNPVLIGKINHCLGRHLTGDGGDMSENDKVSNFQAIMNGRARIHSGYFVEEVPRGKIWIITEADRTLTTITMPNED
jgi:hypothetical protein